MASLKVFEIEYILLTLFELFVRLIGCVCVCELDDDIVVTQSKANTKLVNKSQKGEGKKLFDPGLKCRIISNGFMLNTSQND